jgi:hypothetical protein
LTIENPATPPEMPLADPAQPAGAGHYLGYSQANPGPVLYTCK